MNLLMVMSNTEFNSTLYDELKARINEALVESYQRLIKHSEVKQGLDYSKFSIKLREIAEDFEDYLPLGFTRKRFLEVVYPLLKDHFDFLPFDERGDVVSYEYIGYYNGDNI